MSSNQQPGSLNIPTSGTMIWFSVTEIHIQVAKIFQRCLSSETTELEVFGTICP